MTISFRATPKLGLLRRRLRSVLIPERATRALQLSRATGVPPLAVHEDLDRFEEDHKANLTANIVRGNSQISSYIRGNALADHVSNDDYGNLDTTSRSFNDVLEKSKTLAEYLPGYHIIKSGIDSFEQPFLKTEQGPQDGLAGAVVRSADIIGKSVALLAAPMAGPVEWVHKVALDISGDENIATRISREFGGNT